MYWVKKKSVGQITKFIGILGLIAITPLSACTSKVGDSCSSNQDCSPTGALICDLSKPGGYCTVQGCNQRDCPDDGICVSFYPIDFLSTSCDPSREDNIDDLSISEDRCAPYEICLGDGRCASKLSASRFCMQQCENDDNCRDDYLCRDTGKDGAESVFSGQLFENKDDDITSERFCGLPTDVAPL